MKKIALLLSLLTMIFVGCEKIKTGFNNFKDGNSLNINQEEKSTYKEEKTDTQHTDKNNTKTNTSTPLGNVPWAVPPYDPAFTNPFTQTSSPHPLLYTYWGKPHQAMDSLDTSHQQLYAESKQ